MKFSLTILKIFAFSLVIVQASSNKLPKGFLRCKQHDPDFDACILKGSKLAIDELSNGQSKFGIPPIDPLRISTLCIDQGEGSVAIKLNFTDLDIHGLSKAELQEVSVQPDEPTIKLRLSTKLPLILNGTYNIIGNILILPISGNGYCKLALEGFTASVKAHFKSIVKHSQVYWHLDNMDFTFDTTKLIMRLENLFNGNKALGENMNKFLNENWSLLLDELRSAFNIALSRVFSDITKRFFDHVPITEVFPTQ